MKEIANLLKIQKEVRAKEQTFHALEAKTDPTESEVEERERIDREIETLRAKEIEALEAAQKAQEADVLETKATSPKEERERRELRSKVGLGGYLAQRLDGHDVWQSEFAEYAAATNAKPNEIPIALFERESRAVTDAPSKASQTLEAISTSQPAVEYAFSPAVATSLGVVLRPVGPGESHHVVVATSPPAATRAKSASLPNTAAVLSLEARKPVRLGAQFEVAVEDSALYPSLTDDLDRSGAAAVSDNLETEILKGSGAAPHLTGLLESATDVAVAGTTETFVSGVKRFGSLVTGTAHATDWSDIRAVIGPATFTAFVSTLATSTSTNLYDFLKGKLGSLVVSDRIPAKASDGQKVLATLMGRMEPIVVPIWSSMPMRIDDDLSAAGSGKKIVTLFVLVGDPFIPYGTSMVKELHPKIS